MEFRNGALIIVTDRAQGDRGPETGSAVRNR